MVKLGPLLYMRSFSDGLFHRVIVKYLKENVAWEDKISWHMLLADLCKLANPEAQLICFGISRAVRLRDKIRSSVDVSSCTNIKIVSTVCITAYSGHIFNFNY